MKNYITYQEAVDLLQNSTKAESAEWRLSKLLEWNIVLRVEKNGQILYQRDSLLDAVPQKKHELFPHIVKPNYTLVLTGEGKFIRYTPCLLLDDILLFATFINDKTLSDSITKDGLYELFDTSECIFECCGNYVDVSLDYVEGQSGQDDKHSFVYWKAFAEKYSIGEESNRYIGGVAAEIIDNADKDKLLDFRNPLHASEFKTENVTIMPPFVFLREDLEELIPKIKLVNEIRSEHV